MLIPSSLNQLVSRGYSPASGFVVEHFVLWLFMLNVDLFYIDQAQNDVGSELNATQNFIEDSMHGIPVLMQALVAVTKVHPFLQGGTRSL